MKYGPSIVTDNMVFNFDAGNVKCTDADDDVTSMRDIALTAHSSRTDRGLTGTGNTGNFSFPTDSGASKVIDLSISASNQASDSDDYDNRIAFDDDIVFADEDAWSCEFWAKPASGAQHTYLSLAGRGATNNWIIWQHGSSTWYPRYRESGSGSPYRRDSANTNVYNPDDWHQVVFTVDTSRNISFYVDGALLGGSVALTSSYLKVNRLMAGYSSSTNRYGFQGVMLCARIYAKPLSAAEVLQNFNATRGRVGI